MSNWRRFCTWAQHSDLCFQTTLAGAFLRECHVARVYSLETPIFSELLASLCLIRCPCESIIFLVSSLKSLSNNWFYLLTTARPGRITRSYLIRPHRGPKRNKLKSRFCDYTLSSQVYEDFTTTWLLLFPKLVFLQRCHHPLSNKLMSKFSK